MTRPRIFGVPVDGLTMDQTVTRCADLVESGVAAQHVSLNAGKVVLMHDDRGLLEIVARCDLVSADGMSVVWAGRWLGCALPERVSGIDLMARLLALAESRGWPVFFYGARAAVLPRFVAEAQRRHPRLVVAGAHHGFADDPAEVAASVAASGARLLFVGISSPFKERFLATHLPQMPLFAMGVGGAFDVWAGETRRAPAWMQRCGLEWFYRLSQEPGRMWRRYLLGNLRFAWLVLQARLGFRDSLA